MTVRRTSPPRPRWPPRGLVCRRRRTPAPARCLLGACRALTPGPLGPRLLGTEARAPTSHRHTAPAAGRPPLHALRIRTRYGYSPTLYLARQPRPTLRQDPPPEPAPSALGGRPALCRPTGRRNTAQRLAQRLAGAGYRRPGRPRSGPARPGGGHRPLRLLCQDSPLPEELYERAATFQSARIYDRSGRLLFEFFDPEGGRRTVAAYEEIPDVVVHATVATEDASFFTNPGVSPLSTARALWQDLRAGEAVYGGSTITQQVVKNLFLTRERTVARKVQEAILATELTRRYSKEEILTVYLNDAYFGNLAYGISAAADTYFGKDTEDLELHEAALLAGLIQAPVLYDPYAYPDAALARRGIVLGLMQRRGYIDASQCAPPRRCPGRAQSHGQHACPAHGHARARAAGGTGGRTAPLPRGAAGPHHARPRPPRSRPRRPCAREWRGWRG